MTKRMLSLLLALVMTLSLCVPALAADEFAAEAVTEVEEQAPEAPEAPVAPEAEEPAEEPAEEADAPEAAVILADEPATIAGIDVTEANVEALVAAVKNAEKYEDGVKDGTYHGEGKITVVDGVVTQVGSHGSEDIKGLTITATPLKCCGEYVFWLARARYAMDQLEDAAGSLRDSDVINITNNLNAAVNGLSTSVSSADGCFWDHSAAYSFAAAFADARNQKLYAYKEQYSYTFKKYCVSTDAVKTFEGWLDALQDGKFDDLYRADYLEDLKAVVYDMLQYMKENFSGTRAYNEMSHKELLDLVTSAKAVEQGSDAEVAARTPTHAEASVLKDLIVEAHELLMDDYSENSEKALRDVLEGHEDGGKKYAAMEYVRSGDPAFDGDHPYWKDSNMSNLQDYITLKKLDDAIDALTKLIDGLKPNYYSARISEVYLVNQGDDPAQIQVRFNKTDDRNGVDDNHEYVVKVECNGYEVTALKYDGNLDGKWDEVDKPITASATSFNVTSDLALVELTVFKPEWKTIEQVSSGTEFVAKLYAYEKGGSPTTSRLTLVDTCKLTVAKSGIYNNNTPIYKAPEIREANYIISGNAANAQLGVNDLKTASDVFYLKLNVPGKTDNGLQTTPDYGKVKIELVDPNGNKVTLINGDLDNTYYWWPLTDKATQNSIDVNFAGLDIVPGTWTFNLYVQDKSNLTGGRDGYPTTPNDTETVTVPAITAYSGYTKLLAKIEKLSGYESMVATHDARTHQKATTASARAHAALLLTEVKEITDKASSLVNNAKNRAAVEQMNTELAKGLAELTDMADYTALNALITVAQGLSSSDYTAMSWHYFQDKAPIKAAQAVVTAAWGKDNQMVVDRAVRSLQYDINALVVAEGKISKAALEAAIIAAKALKEEDYTAESWAAADLKTAIAAAQKVYDKPNATQAEVDKAVVDLNAAVALLVEVTPPEPEGPKAPASGTGWTYYDGEWYFFKNGSLVSNYWVGYVDGASQWANNWYYVGADGKMLTGFQYLDDLKGGKAWYMLQNTPKDGEIGKMLTGYQWTYTSAGEGYFSPKYGSQGACTWTEAWGSYKASTGLWGDGLAHKG